MSVTDGPGEGSWSVFAEKVVAERDKLRDELAQRTIERDQARRAAETGNGSWIWGDGDDDLSSLSNDAQVQIRAETLRKLISEARDAAREKAEALLACTICGLAANDECHGSLPYDGRNTHTYQGKRSR